MRQITRKNLLLSILGLCRRVAPREIASTLRPVRPNCGHDFPIVQDALRNGLLTQSEQATSALPLPVNIYCYQCQVTIRTISPKCSHNRLISSERITYSATIADMSVARGSAKSINPPKNLSSLLPLRVGKRATTNHKRLPIKLRTDAPSNHFSPLSPNSLIVFAKSAILTTPQRLTMKRKTVSNTDRCDAPDWFE